MNQESRNVTVGHPWRPIEDLPDDWRRLADSDLHQLADNWRERREDLGAQGVIADFNERLKREWAIETGLIERVYTLTRGITEILIERGLREEFIPSSATDRDPALVFDMIRDHAAAVDGLFDFVKQERQLSTSYIKELHSALLAHQVTASARDIFGRRVEMPLATLVMIRAGWFPLVVTDAGRADYIDALEAADAGDLRPLVRLFSDIQRRAFEGAMSAVRDAPTSARRSPRPRRSSSPAPPASPPGPASS